jgi:hypothetical protein
MYNGFLIDDEERASVIAFAELLNSAQPEKLSITYLPLDELAPLGFTLVEKRPSVVIMDYRLDETSSGLDSQNRYKGTALAQIIRDKIAQNMIPEFPIVLLSAEEKIRKHLAHNDANRDLFDYIFSKEDISENSEQAAILIVSLCDSFGILESTWLSISVEFLLKIDKSEAAVINFKSLSHALATAVTPHNFITYFINNVIKREGLLFSREQVATVFGIRFDDFELIIPYLTDRRTRYTGIMSDAWERWWAYRAISAAEEVFKARYTNLTASERAALLEARLKETVHPAISSWTGKTDEKLVSVCCSCKRPTEVKYSLSIYEATIIDFALPNRICWDCIQKDRDRNFIIADTDIKYIDKIKKERR